MELVQAYRYIAIHVGEIIKWTNVTRDIEYSQQIYLGGIKIEEFPNDTITSIRQRLFYNSVLSLARERLEQSERNIMLKSFIKGIVKDNHEIILNINKEIQKTGYIELLIDTDDTIKVDIDAINNLSISTIDSHIDKCKTKIIQKDYTGAITNARSLLEVVYLKIIKDSGGNIDIFKGDLTKMYGAIKGILQLKQQNTQLIQLLAGFASITNSISSLSNISLSDRHGHLEEDNNYIYAELLVNLVFSISNFLIKNKNLTS